MNSMIRSRQSWIKRKAIVCVVVIIAVSMGLLLLWVTLDFHYMLVEAEALFNPKDRSKIWIDKWLYSSEGIVLDVYAPMGVAEVWKWDEGLPWGRWRWPWHSQFCPVPFRIVAGDRAWHTTVLVDWPFNPGNEWALYIRSQDGYWTSESPYFSNKPDLTGEEWNELVKRSRLVVPNH